MSLSEKVNSSKLPENQIHKSTQEKNPTHFQMPTNTSALSTYDRLIHSNNTTEEVVKIGGMIQQDFFNLTNVTSLGGGGGDFWTRLYGEREKIIFFLQF